MAATAGPTASSPFWKALQRLGWDAAVIAPPPVLPAVPAPAGLALEELGLLPRIRWDRGLAARWRPGEAGALEALERFLDGTLPGYPEQRDHPDLAATSGLSPHLHFGEIGPRQLAAAARSPAHSASVQAAAESWRRQLGWREFAHHLLFHFPHTTDAPLDPRFERFPWNTREPELLTAWQRGRTGIPLVDAGMRELWETGWMHNRVRMVVASLLTKNLRLPWLEGARWFWDTLVDADLANNTLGWQWSAGCGADAAPYFRIFNPVLQGQRFDPAGGYVRRWVPELAGLPDRYLQCPWAAPPHLLATAGVRLGSDYPLPVVDLQSSREAAVKAFRVFQELEFSAANAWTCRDF